MCTVETRIFANLFDNSFRIVSVHIFRWWILRKPRISYWLMLNRIFNNNWIIFLKKKKRSTYIMLLIDLNFTLVGKQFHTDDDLTLKSFTSATSYSFSPISIRNTSIWFDVSETFRFWVFNSELIENLQNIKLKYHKQKKTLKMVFTAHRYSQFSVTTFTSGITRQAMSIFFFWIQRFFG